MSEEKTINRVRQLDPGHATGKNAGELEGYLNFGAALAAGALDAKVREQISWQWPRPPLRVLLECAQVYGS